MNQLPFSYLLWLYVSKLIDMLSTYQFNEFNNDSDIEAFIERSLKNNFVSNAPIDMNYFDILRDEVLANE